MTTRRFERSAILLGNSAMDFLKNTHVCVAGIGGVGSYATEALARASVGELTIIDYAKVEEHNINRQLYALSSTIGLYKTNVAKERILQINDKCKVHAFSQRIFVDNICQFNIESCDAIIDCIDDLTAKIALLTWAAHNAIPVITSVMGASTRMNSAMVQSGDISVTSHCPVAKKVRRQLKLKGIDKGIFAIYSTESPRNTNMSSSNHGQKQLSGTSMGSFSCLPGIFGLSAAQETLNKLLY